MPRYTQEMFATELQKMIGNEQARGGMPCTITAQEVHDKVIPRGTKNANGKLVTRWTSVCSAMRLRADIEKPVNGKRRGKCLHTTDSGNSPSVTYEYNS